MKRLAMVAMAMALVGCSPDAAPVNHASVNPDQDERCTSAKEPYQPVNLIDNRELAIKVARQYFLEGQARGHLRGDLLPLDARLQHGVWAVRETLPLGSAGGGFNIEICQSNGRVLRYWTEM